MAWVRFVLALTERHRLRPERILDLACGTGTVTRILCSRGYEMVGIDGSPAMLAVARQKAAAARMEIPFLVSDLRYFKAPGQFDLVLCLYDSLNNILEPEGLARAFQCVRKALAPGGLFIFDMNTEYAFRADLFSQQNLKPDSPVQYRWNSQYDYSTRICTVRMHFWVLEEGERREFEEVHHQRAYNMVELERLLDAAGLRLDGSYDGLTYRAPSHRTDRVYCVARVKEEQEMVQGIANDRYRSAPA